MNKYQEQHDALQVIIQLLETDFVNNDGDDYDYDDEAEYIMEERKAFESLKDALTLNGRSRCIECRAREVVKFLKEIQDDCYNEE